MAEDLERDEVWLSKSASIAASVLSILRAKKMTKQDLADKMGVKPQSSPQSVLNDGDM